MLPSRASSAPSPLRAMRSTCCSAPTCATHACSGVGSTGSRADALRAGRTWNRFTSGLSEFAFGPTSAGYLADIAEDLRRVLVRVRLLVGRRVGHGKSARQREGFALVKRPDAALVEARLFDLQIGAVQRVRRQLLHRKANRFCRGAKSPIGKARPLLLADRGGEKFGGGVEAERTHAR